MNPPSRDLRGLKLSRRFVIGPEAARLFELAALLAAFCVAFTGVRILEDHGSATSALIRFGLATLLLAAATWRVRDRAGMTHGVKELPSLGAAWRSPAQLARNFAGSWQALCLLMVLASAASLTVYLRLHLITSDPYGIWFDEAQNGIVAKGIVDGDRPIFVGGLTQLPALFFYAFAASITLAGDNVTALRGVTAIAGMVTVLFVYLLGRELFDHRVGVFAAFFLSVMRWHLNFSRFGMHGIFAPLFMVMTFYFAARGLHGKGAWNFAIAGVLAGLGLQGYYGFLLAPFVGLLYVSHYAVFERRLPWQRLGAGLVVLSACAAIVYAPLGVWAYRHPEEFNQRSSTVTITKDRSWSEAIDVAWSSTKKHLLMFHSAGDRNGRHNIPGEPMLDTAMGLMFILGLGYAATRLHRTACFLLLAWIAVCLQSGIWSVEFEAPQAYRTIGVTPAVALLAALPLSLLWRMVADFPRDNAAVAASSWTAVRSRGIGISLAASAVIGTVALLAWTARVNYDRYFNEQLRRFDAWTAYDTDSTYVAKEIDRLGATAHEYRVSAVLHRRPVMLFLNPELDASGNARAFDWPVDVPSGADGSTVYLLDVVKEPFWDWLQRLYPAATFDSLTSPLNDPRPVAFEAVVSSDAVRALQGIDSLYAGEPTAPVRRREASLSLDWSSTAPLSPPFDAVWMTSMRVGTYGTHQLTLEVPGSARIFMDGELIAEGTARVEVTKRLYKGDHELRVEARIERTGRVALLVDGAPPLSGSFFSYPLAGHGLIGTFYSGTEFEGEPVLQQLDPFIGFRFHGELTGVTLPLSARWTGVLAATVPGVYAFELEGNETTELYLDGRRIDATPGQHNEIELTAGEHLIEVRLTNAAGYAGIFLYWWPPGSSARVIVPPEALKPR